MNLGDSGLGHLTFHNLATCKMSYTIATWTQKAVKLKREII